MTENNYDCLYIHHENGIHEYVFLRATRKSIDEWIAHADIAMQNQPMDRPAHTLVDISQSGMPPINYTMSRARTWQGANKERPSGRIAVLYHPGLFLSMVEGLIGMLSRRGQEQYRFFPEGKREEAVAWLLAAEERLS